MDLLRLIADERCVACDAAGAILCRPCRRALSWLGEPACTRCGGPSDGPCATCAGLDPELGSVRSALVLDGSGARAVRAWKDAGRTPVAELAERCLAAILAPPATDALVPVPAAAERAAWRGVDGPRMLAERLGRRWGIPVRRDLLVRADDGPQRGLGGLRRRARAPGLYTARGVPPRTCLVIDDVMTTGATLGACARALREAGAERVDAATFARAVREPLPTALPRGRNGE